MVDFSTDFNSPFSIQFKFDGIFIATPIKGPFSELFLIFFFNKKNTRTEFPIFAVFAPQTSRRAHTVLVFSALTNNRIDDDLLSHEFTSRRNHIPGPCFINHFFDRDHLFALEEHTLAYSRFVIHNSCFMKFREMDRGDSPVRLLAWRSSYCGTVLDRRYF